MEAERRALDENWVSITPERLRWTLRQARTAVLPPGTPGAEPEEAEAVVQAAVAVPAPGRGVR